MNAIGKLAMFGLALVVLALPASALAVDIGTVAAVNQEMRGTPPQQAQRVLLLGDEVISNERIETSSDGSGQLLFLDQTTLTVAPNSNLVLDKYVYDPNREAGDVALSITRGTLRFIGGKITKNRSGLVRTPSATIAIRGGMAIITVGADGSLRAIFLAGDSMTVTRFGDANADGLDDGPKETEGADGPAGELVVTRPGGLATASLAEGVSYAGTVNSGALSAIFLSLEGSGAGGTAAPPRQSVVADRAGAISSGLSGVTAGYQLSPVGTDGGVTAKTGDPVIPPGVLDQNAESQNANNLSQELEDLLPDIAEMGGDSPFGMIPQLSDISGLTGTASYSGDAVGLSFDAELGLDDPGARALEGTFDMVFDFDRRNGAIDLNIPDGSFTVDLLAGDNSYAGSDPIFGGPDTILVEGGFIAGGGDPAAATQGSFGIDFQTQGRAVAGAFEGPRE